MNQTINRVGIDLAKNVFQLCATDIKGRVVFNRQVSRRKLPVTLANIPSCEVVMEACASADYWSRVCVRLGHDVKQIHPAYVKPFVQSQKNDATDALALCEAAARPTMRFVRPKTLEQQDIQALHRVRQRQVTQRTALVNQIRGLLGEYGVVVAQGVHRLCQQLPDILGDASNELTPRARHLFSDLYEELTELNQRIKATQEKLETFSETHEECRRLKTVPGIGPLNATALYVALGDANQFSNGRGFAAYLGLVPRQCSTGGKTILKGISKRGDRQMRTLLIQGAQAALRHMHKKEDRLSRWACALKARRGTAVAVVALANKLARICWALSTQQTVYQPR